VGAREALRTRRGIVEGLGATLRRSPAGGSAFARVGRRDTVRMSAGKETLMPVYISLVKWTDQGRAKASSLPDRVAEVDKRIEAVGGRSIGNWLTMGRFDQIAVVEAPDDETAAKLLMVVAERGNAVTETLRAFTMDEVRSVLA
jgi:uncharacterized protein with GYD domain